MANLKGIDCCGYQGTIDFSIVKNNGYDFAIIKAGYSESTVESWERNYANARQSGLRVGAYWYSYATDVEGFRREARAFVAALKGKRLDFPVYLDLEEQSALSQGKAKCSQFANAFCEVLEDAGYYAGVYCSTYWATTCLDKTVFNGAFGERPFWCADYRGGCYYEGKYGIWQYGAGPVPGVQYDCDLNVGYEDYGEFILEHGLNGYRLDIPIPGTRKTVDELAREVLDGLWDNGQKRYDLLTAEGYDYDAVQKRVNEILYPPRKTVEELAREVLNGDWGNGVERYKRLTEAGYVYDQVQRRVNEIIYNS